MNSNVLIGEIIFSVVRLVLLVSPLSESEWVGDEMGARDPAFPTRISILKFRLSADPCRLEI